MFMKQFTCPCLKGIVALFSILIVLFIVICVFHTYDGKATWMDWANLIVSAVGSIFLSFLIYWFGSVKAEEKKERNKQIELINRLFGDYIRSSRKLIYLLNVLSPIKGKLSLAISLIDKKQYTQEQFADTFKVANNIPSSLILFNVKEEEFSLLAKESPELYLNLLVLYEKLLNLRDALTQYSIDVKENLEMYRTELKKYGGTPLRGGIITDIEKNYFERILNHIENPLVLSECCVYCLSTVIKDSIKLVNNKYRNDIPVNCPDIHKKFFDPIINYKFELFDLEKYIVR